MRRALLAGACLAALAGPAEAQVATYCVNCTAEFSEVFRETARAAQVVKELAQLKAQYDQLVQTYQALAHAPEDALNQLAGTFNTSALRSPLPGSDALGSAISGLQGANNSLSGLVGTFTGQNRIYTPYGGDYSSNAMLTNANSIAGVQAAVKALIDSAQQHSTALTQMEGQLAGAPDTKAVGDIQARIALETAQLQTKQIQAAALTSWQGAQVRNTDQQRAESRRCYIEAMLNGSDTTQDTCARPASQGAVQLASAGTGGGVGLASGWEAYLGQAVGSGQCVALPQALDSSLGLTRTWTQGASVQGNTGLVAGTPIATFDSGGRYANATDGSSHAAVYLGQDEKGIQVVDQWLGHPAATRTIPWSGSTQANAGSAFYVINH